MANSSKSQIQAQFKFADIIFKYTGIKVSQILKQTEAENNSGLEAWDIPEEQSRYMNIQEQKRLQNIVQVIRLIAENFDTTELISSEPIDEEWLMRFFSYAEEAFVKEKQGAWARIFIKEMKKPGTNPFLTLETLRNFSGEEVNMVKNASQYLMAKTSLCIEEFGLPEKYIQPLQEMGILREQRLQFQITVEAQKELMLPLSSSLIIYTDVATKPIQVGISVLELTSKGVKLLDGFFDPADNRKFVKNLAMYLKAQGLGRVYVAPLISVNKGREVFSPANAKEIKG